MKSIKITLIATLNSLLLLTGCATNYAQDVVKRGAPNYIIRYSPNDSDYQPITDVKDLGGISLFTVIQLAGAGYAGSIDGIGGAAESLAMDEAVANRRLKPGEFNMLFSWLPVGYADSPESVEEKYVNEVTEIIDSVVSEHGMAINFKNPIIPAGGWGRKIYRVSGASCGVPEEPKCLIELSLTGKLIRKPQMVPAPSILKDLDGQNVWAVTTRGGAQVSHRNVAFRAPADLDINVAQIYVEISNRLPGYSYLYLAKSPTFHVPVGEPGKIKGYYYVLSDGKELSFARK